MCDDILLFLCDLLEFISCINRYYFGFLLIIRLFDSLEVCTLAKALDVHVDHQAHLVLSFSQPALLGGIAKPQSTNVMSVNLCSGSRGAGSRKPAMCLKIVSLFCLALVV